MSTRSAVALLLVLFIAATGALFLYNRGADASTASRSMTDAFPTAEASFARQWTAVGAR